MRRLALVISMASFCCVGGNALADIFGTGLNQFELEFVTIGDVGNRADRSGNPNPAGSVGYVYDIGKYEISRDMIERANAEAGLELTLDAMDFVTGGPRPNMPATGVSWNEAARFVNWLNTSQGFSAAYKFSTQPGDADYDANANIELWEPADLGYDPANRFRNRMANYVLPTVHEWYKAAFYDPSVYGGFGGYWNFPNGSNEAPIPVASGTEPGTAVHSQRSVQGPADITQSGGLSPYGVMGLGGNVWEWEETEIDLVNDTPFSIRGVRGGRWLNHPHHLRVFDRDDDDFPTYELFNTGFRVASIPKPDWQVPFDITPGLGEFAGEGSIDSSLRVAQIRDGFRVTAFHAGSDDSALPKLSASWPAEEGQWYRFVAEVDSVSTTNDAKDARDAIIGLESSDSLRFGSHVLAPKPSSGRYDFAWQFNPTTDVFGDVSLTWQASVVPIGPPIPGDANGDGTVSVVDFLALADQFGLDQWGWSGGDFNLDGTTDFKDFLILHDNFGRTAIVAAAIPEPSSLMLFATGFMVLVTAMKLRTRYV